MWEDVPKILEHLKAHPRDEEAWTKLYKASRAYCLGVFRRAGCVNRGDQEAAHHELIRKTMTRFQADDAPEIRCPKSWFVGVAYNISRRCTKEAMKRRRSESFSEAHATSHQPVEAEGKWLPGCVEQLSEEEQVLLRALFVEGKRIADIERETGVPHSTLRSRRDKAIEKLRDCLGIEGENLN